ncbi:AMP phosphorylase [Methanosarcina sp. KYL-1]|uniref:AMP phosphorylase n=1 Tax=Methanosarcina sp. KYL-1 TaxID=2602068 RepID=UPI002101C541|nr:AMP phosphorylase [Methanosarcina sp. KYL-1]MCQ1536503.1 AMP phosphorylase [Methanosarcina sp. KYL-1]
MQLKLEHFDIKIGQHKVMFNIADAKELGVNPGDRVRIRGHESLSAIVDTTVDLVPPGTLGVFTEVYEHFKHWEKPVEVFPALRSKSSFVIKKMMDKQSLTREEIKMVVSDVVDENLSDIELSAFMTASYIHGMSDDEIEWLTRAMIDTGERIEFDTHPIMDKHSIGGVPGNKISLLVVPIIAANGLLIPKTSSRAITGAGGTADLMEVLCPVEFTSQEVKEITENVGGALVWGGATNIAPADDKLIRVEYPLSIDPYCQMLASIMAKKGAIGADNVVIDIPTGAGTKVPNVQEGQKLARDLINLGHRLGMNVECAITYGSSPIGRKVGPSLEVREALKVLESFEGPNSLIEKSAALAGILLEMGGAAPRDHGKELALETLRSGKALEKMKQIIEAQGGDPNVTSADIPVGEYTADICASADGYVIEFDNKWIVEIARLAGAPNDKGAGVALHKKMGESVKKGDPILTIYAEKEFKLDTALTTAQRTNPILVEGMLLRRIPGTFGFQ